MILSFMPKFGGRISRLCYLVNRIIAYFVLGIIVACVFNLYPASTLRTRFDGSDPQVQIVMFFWLWHTVLVASYAVRRLHDRDKSGWWSLVGFIPAIGPLWILVECVFLRGTVGVNRFGADPLAAAALGDDQKIETDASHLN